MGRGVPCSQSCSCALHLGQREVTFCPWWGLLVFFKLCTQEGVSLSRRRPLISYPTDTILFTTCPSSKLTTAFSSLPPTWNLPWPILRHLTSWPSLLISPHFSWFSRVLPFSLRHSLTTPAYTANILTSNFHMILDIGLSCLYSTKSNESSKAISTLSWKYKFSKSEPFKVFQQRSNWHKVLYKYL